jgi:nucleoside-diphosphate-sugar epimerase
MSHFLVTGGSGFFGGILKRRLLSEGHTVVNIDLELDEDAFGSLTSIQGDLRDGKLVQRIFAEHRFDGVFHAAAQFAHGMKPDKHLLWTSNVDATRQLAEITRSAGVRPFVFISSNCLWAANMGRPVNEDWDVPAPVEPYGKSKLAGERLLEEFKCDLDVVTLRCPTIMDAGRLGLLAILYEFIDDHKNLWVVGKGDNRYQFIYAEDLATACIQAAAYGRSDLFHIGSDHVMPMREVYQAVIDASCSRSRVRSLPKGPAIAAMMLAHKLRLSPLGPYHYKMIAESFIFDTARIKERLGWRPTLSNEEMLLKSYNFYARHRREIAVRTDASAHRKPASMGVIRILKWLS